MKLSITRIIQDPIGTNGYVISDGISSIIIDPGSKEAKNYFDEAIQGRLVAVVLTHLHWDHSAAAHLFDAPIYIHKEELVDTELQQQLAQRSLGEALILPAFEHLQEHMKLESIEFDVLHTPGHTKGGVCLLFDDFLISGDTLFAQTYGRTDIGGNDEHMKKSLLKLSQLKPELLVLPGHGEPTTIGAEKHWIEQL